MLKRFVPSKPVARMAVHSFAGVGLAGAALAFLDQGNAKAAVLYLALALLSAVGVRFLAR